MYSLVLLLFVLIAVTSPALAQDTNAKPQTLFTNVHVFDGKNEVPIEEANVLVEGNLMKQVSVEPIRNVG